MRAMLMAMVMLGGCYHFAFEQRPYQGATVTYERRVATYVNGFVGTGRIDVREYCEEPVRTKLHVSATDVLISVVTLLVYTPHTLSVTCPAR